MPTSLRRRLGATLAGLLLLQLTLLGSGTLCMLQHIEMPSGRTGAAHAMEPGRAPAQRSVSAVDEAGSAAPMSPTGCGEAQRASDCHLPWASGHCASMQSCTVTTVAPAGLAIAANAARTASLLPEPSSLRSRAALAPDLPPPRA